MIAFTAERVNYPRPTPPQQSFKHWAELLQRSIRERTGAALPAASLTETLAVAAPQTAPPPGPAAPPQSSADGAALHRPPVAVPRPGGSPPQAGAHAAAAGSAVPVRGGQSIKNMQKRLNVHYAKYSARGPEDVCMSLWRCPDHRTESRGRQNPVRVKLFCASPNPSESYLWVKPTDWITEI